MREWPVAVMRRAFAGLVVLLAAACGAAAQDAYPSRPVHLMVPFPPGGAVDIVARTLGDELSKRWGQTIVVENRPGAGGTIAAAAAAKAAADGYTLILVASGHAIVSHLYADLPYDPRRDFTPISLVGSSPNMLLVRADSPFKSVADVLAAARAKPGALSYGYPGNGTSPHLAGDALWAQLQARMTNVPYKGSSPSELAILSGEADVSMLTPLATLNHIQAGRLKAYGITSAQRSPVLPDVPTLAEQGVEGYDIQFWNGLFAPAGTPASAVRAAHSGLVQALQVPEVKERFRQLGLVIVGNTPEEFSIVVKRDVEKFRKIIVESGIQRL